jgi:hypothetical protein
MIKPKHSGRKILNYLLSNWRFERALNRARSRYTASLILCYHIGEQGGSFTEGAHKIRGRAAHRIQMLNSLTTRQKRLA